MITTQFEEQYFLFFCFGLNILATKRTASLECSVAIVQNIVFGLLVSYDDVRYISGISSLKADKAEIDILNKKTKIFMEDSNKKVQNKQ